MDTASKLQRGYFEVSILGVVFSGWIMNSDEAATAGSPLDFLLFFSKNEF
jgi:hypothetical protein